MLANVNGQLQERVTFPTLCPLKVADNLNPFEEMSYMLPRSSFFFIGDSDAPPALHGFLHGRLPQLLLQAAPAPTRQKRCWKREWTLQCAFTLYKQDCDNKHRTKTSKRLLVFEMTCTGRVGVGHSHRLVPQDKWRAKRGVGAIGVQLVAPQSPGD